MSIKYLFGPVPLEIAQRKLHRARQAGDCLVFNADGDIDLKIADGDSWDIIRSRFPSGWTPDFVALWPAYATIPAALWAAPIVRIGLAVDWKERWHAYRRMLPSCAAVFADAPGAERLQIAGLSNVHSADLDGCNRIAADPADGNHSSENHPRDIDVLFVDSFPAVNHHERSPLLWSLASMSRKWRVEARGEMPVDSLRKLLMRSRIAVQFAGRHDSPSLALEAAAAGALVFQGHCGCGAAGILRDRQECVQFQPDQLASLLQNYLEQENERRSLAEAARRRVGESCFEDRWGELVDRVTHDWPRFQIQTSEVAEQRTADLLLGRSLLALGRDEFDDHFLLAELLRVISNSSTSAEPEGDTKTLLRLAMGVTLAKQAEGTGHAVAAAEVAAEHFRRILDDRPKCLLAGLNLAEALHVAGQKLGAIEAAHRTLEVLSCKPELDDCDLECLFYPRRRDTLHAEWERAAWENLGQRSQEARIKRDLIACRLQTLLGHCSDNVSHYYEATMLRPDLPDTRADLGLALVKAGKLSDARKHLSIAAETNPLNRPVARALFHTLSALGDVEARRTFSEQQRLLQRAVPAMVQLEPWFAEPPPRSDDLTSLIVVCCNQLEFTRQCLDSVLKHTRTPYELIVVDNGSNDETPAYLSELGGRPGPARVEIIRNDSNLGHPAAVNQALAQSRGRFVVFLDNDTVVTPAWLDGLIQVALQDWPRNGMVGPVTNGAPDVQAIRPGYRELTDLDAFALERRRAFGGKVIGSARLTSFCLLARRDVLDRIGPWDERFHPGFFVDDDLSVRAREAGYRLVLALDVYVHHFGHRTFRSLGDDSRQKLLENFRRFEDKWGKEYTKGYQFLEPTGDDAKRVQIKDESAAPSEAPSLPQAEEPHKDVEAASVEPSNGQPAVAAQPPLPGISLCMIVKNEEHHLPDCLRSVQQIFDQMVVLDTGSNDRTRQVAESFGAEVYDFPWVESFAAARNESLRHARHRWVLWLDADDRLDADNRDRLQKVLANLGDERDAYAMKVRSVLDAEARIFRVLDQVRLFRNLPDVRWDYRIHEQILPAVNRIGGVVRWADVTIDHVGYQQAGARKSKLERNLRILELDFADRPDDGFTLFNLGWTLLDLGRTDEALKHLKNALEHTRPTSSTLRKLYHLLTVAQRGIKAIDESLAVCRDGLKKFPDDGELLFEEGVLLRDRGDLLDAERSWLRLLDMPRGQYFASEEVGLRGFRTRQFLAEVYRAQERFLEAEVQWRAALKDRLDFEPAWMGLAELYLKQSRTPDLEYLLQVLENAGLALAKLGWLRARGQAQRKDLAAARRTLETVITQDPAALGPRVLFSQVLLQEGQDWDAAERALRDVLTLDANHAETKHNLSVLLRRLGRGPTAG